MFPQHLNVRYLQQSFSRRVELTPGNFLPNDVFAGYENPLRHAMQGHGVEQNPGREQYRDWFVHVFGQPLVAGLGTPVRNNWQFPPTAVAAFFSRLFELTDEAISAERYYTYAVPGEAGAWNWRATAVSSGGLIIALQWHGVWCPWTLFFSSDFHPGQSDALNRRHAMWSQLNTMTFGLSTNRGLKRVPTPDDRVRVWNRRGEECRTRIAFADLGVWGERGGYFDRRQIQ